MIPAICATAATFPFAVLPVRMASSVSGGGADAPLRDGEALRGGLVGHVHHTGAAALVEVGESAVAHVVASGSVLGAAPEPGDTTAGLFRGSGSPHKLPVRSPLLRSEPRTKQTCASLPPLQLVGTPTHRSATFREVGKRLVAYLGPPLPVPLPARGRGCRSGPLWCEARTETAGSRQGRQARQGVLCALCAFARSPSRAACGRRCAPGAASLRIPSPELGGGWRAKQPGGGASVAGCPL